MKNGSSEGVILIFLLGVITGGFLAEWGNEQPDTYQITLFGDDRKIVAVYNSIGEPEPWGNCIQFTNNITETDTRLCGDLVIEKNDYVK